MNITLYKLYEIKIFLGGKVGESFFGGKVWIRESFTRKYYFSLFII